MPRIVPVPSHHRVTVANVALWTVQVALAALFLLVGVTTLVAPMQALTAQSPLSASVLRVIGLLEALSRLGLVLPGLFRVREELTVLAAGGPC